MPSTANMNKNSSSSRDRYPILPSELRTVLMRIRNEVILFTSFNTRSSRKARNTCHHHDDHTSNST